MTRMVNAFVEKLAGFARLEPSDVAVLKGMTEPGRAFVRRQDLIREGDPPGPVFVMLEGWACRYKILPDGGRQILAFLLPGDCCDLNVGLLAQMDHGIQAITDAQVAMIPGTELAEVMFAHPAIARAMYIAQLVDEAVLRSWIVSMGRRLSIERVAHLMCELYLRVVHVQPAEEAELRIPLSQNTLADSLGMTTVHVNRVLRELSKMGIMKLQRGTLTIKDPVALIKVAGFDENYLHRRRLQGPKYR